MTSKIECREDKIVKTITFLYDNSNLSEDDPRATEDLDDKIHEAWGDLVGSFLEIAEALHLQKRIKDKISELNELLSTEAGRGYMDRDKQLLEELLKGPPRAR